MRITRKNRVQVGKSIHRAQRGSTILLVTLILALMGIITLFLIYQVDAQRLVAVYMEQRIRYQQIAESVLQKYLGLLVADDKVDLDTQKEDWFSGGYVQYEDNGYMITVIIEDEGSKPNINLQDPEGFRMLLPISQNEPPIAIDSLLDWLDPDDDTRDKGFELNEYQGLTPPYKPRNGFMASIEEMKAIKDSDKFYSDLAPEMTVHGKINPNVLDSFQFRLFLVAIGFEKLKGKPLVETVCQEFEKYRMQGKGRFNELDDFKNTSMLLGDRDVLEPFVQFKGSCNPNFISKLGMKMMIRQIAQQMAKLGRQVDLNPDLAEGFIKSRDKEPFTSLDTLYQIIPPEKYMTLHIGDYFKLVSTIIRYRIWVVKGTGKYYLESIQERIPVKGIHDWEVHPLTWKALTNNEVPEIPEPPEPPEPPDPTP